MVTVLIGQPPRTILLSLVLLLLLLLIPTMESIEKPSLPLALLEAANRLAVERAVSVAERMEVATADGVGDEPLSIEQPVEFNRRWR